MKKELYITEISEEDFRKLDLKVTENRTVEKSLNDILDSELEYIIEQGWLKDLDSLQIPVYVAICKEGEVYYDKFLNPAGVQTYQIGFGIKHLYSTRDYFECHEDYWRVKKKETKAIYCIHLDLKWKNRFVLKHRTEIVKYFPDHRKDNVHYVKEYFDLVDGKWVSVCKTEIEQYSPQCKSEKKYEGD